MTEEQLPPAGEAGSAGSRIGTDTWASSVDERREERVGILGSLARGVDRIPPPARLGAFLVAASVFPMLTSSDYLVRVGTFTLIYALLAVGLNIVVGFSGLLDLGYVAFFGAGAYAYALLSSDHFGIHWPAQITVPLIAVGSGLLGLLLGLPSRRLLGDYLAVVTLFFLQAFLVITTNGNSISFLGLTPTTDLTGGPNGIIKVDSWRLFGLRIDSVQRHFWLALATFALVVVAVHLVVESRTGRAWKALREDPLAAELMGMPVRRLKLLAFTLGAAVAGIAGTIHASFNAGVFPNDFDLTFLVTIYAMLILGGVGSLTGALLGAVSLSIALEALRDPNQARWIFYALVLVTLAAALRPWRRVALVAALTVGFGFAVHAVVSAVRPGWSDNETAGGDAVARAAQAWVFRPDNATDVGNYAFVALVLAVLSLTLLRGWQRSLALVPTLYVAAFVWENRLVTEPSITRFLLLGSLLIVLMRARPQGLLGTARVELA